MRKAGEKEVSGDPVGLGRNTANPAKVGRYGQVGRRSGITLITLHCPFPSFYLLCCRRETHYELVMLVP